MRWLSFGRCGEKWSLTIDVTAWRIFGSALFRCLNSNTSRDTLLPEPGTQRRHLPAFAPICADLLVFTPFRTRLAAYHHPFSTLHFHHLLAHLPIDTHLTPPTLTRADATCAHLSSTSSSKATHPSHVPFAPWRIAMSAQTRYAPRENTPSPQGPPSPPSRPCGKRLL